jgi:hypothetical protein
MRSWVEPIEEVSARVDSRTIVAEVAVTGNGKKGVQFLLSMTSDFTALG